MKKNRLFVKYVVMNLSLVIVVFLGCLANVFYTYSLEKRNILERNENILMESIGKVEEILHSLYAFSSALRSNDSLRALRGISGNEKLPADKYVFMNYLQKDLSYIQMISNISAVDFVLFRDNQVFVSNTQSSDNFEEYYGVYLQAENQTAEEFKHEIMNCRGQITCKSYSEIEVYHYGQERLKNPLVVIARIMTSNRVIDRSTAFVFIIEREELYRQLFSQEEMGNLICICGSSGDILASYGENAGMLKEYLDMDSEKNETVSIDGEGYYLLKASEEFNGNTILFGIPARQVRIQTIRLLKVMLTVLIFVVLISFAEILFFSYRKSSSMQGLLDDINKHSQIAFANGDEYKFIKENVGLLASSRDAYRTDLANLRSQMRNQILEQMFLQEMISSRELEQCRLLVPVGIDYFYVVVVQCQGEASGTILKAFYMLDKIFEQFEEDNHLGIQTGVNEKSFLIGIGHNELITDRKGYMEEILSEITKGTDEVFRIGVSGIGMNFSSVHTCYIQARQALTVYQQEHTNTIGYYPDLLSSAGDNLTNMDFVSKLYRYLLSGEKQIFLKAMNRLLEHYHMNPGQYEKNAMGIYYAIYHTIVCASKELSVPECCLQLEEWNRNFRFEEGIEALKRSALLLLEKKEENQKSHNYALKKKITDYIAAHFQNPGLTASMVCQEIKISEKYLAQFLKEQTGKTFAKYVEDLRVERAKELLCSTDYSNEKIAELAGFGSSNSFYRIFNKRTGVSPGVFRKKI